jgi:hypothetical protein
LQAASLGKKIVNPTATFFKGDVLAVLGKLPKAKYDLIVTSPPYNIRKIYERSAKLTFEQYIEWLDSVIGALIDTLPKHGSICWQVGTFVKDGEVFSYYEGGKDETAISLLRIQQNLLVTGVIYPQGISRTDRAKFEATLFLEINATQTNARSELKQAIGVLLRPFSQDSIARQIVNSLNDRSALGGHFERYFFDKGKIKTTTIVSYGVKPLIKLSGEDSLFKVWKESNKQGLIDAPTEKLAQAYIQFCSSEINIFISAIKASVAADRWTADQKVKGRMLTTTIINGFIVCLRLLVEHQKLHAFEWYKAKFGASDLNKFPFSKYKSSQYGSLGQDMYKAYFE